MLNASSSASRVDGGVLIPTRLGDYFALSKPGITFVVLMTTFSGFLLASPSLSSVDWNLLLHTLLGTALVSMGAGALNMLLEAEPDALMGRTRMRPLPSKRVSPQEAFFIGTLSASLGVVHLCGSVNLAAGFIAGSGLALYLVFYTPLKTSTPFCTVVGAVSGALPPLIGWSAARGSIGLQALPLFLILFVWQFPHLWALAWIYREDYGRAGFMMTPVAEESGKTISALAFAGCLLLLPVSLIPSWQGLSGPFYFWGALGLGILMAGCSLQFMIKRDARSARTLFLCSILYMPLLLILLVLGR